MALDRRNYKQLVETTVELSNKVRAARQRGSAAARPGWGWVTAQDARGRACTRLRLALPLLACA